MCVVHSTECSLRLLKNKIFKAEHIDWEENQENTAPPEKEEEVPEYDVLRCAEDDEYDAYWGCDTYEILYIGVPCGNMLCKECAKLKYCNNCGDGIVRFDDFPVVY